MIFQLSAIFGWTQAAAGHHIEFREVEAAEMGYRSVSPQLIMPLQPLDVLHVFVLT